MPVQPKQLFQAALTTGDATVYTAPDQNDAQYAELLRVTFCNTTTAAINVRLHIVPKGGAVGTGNALVYDWELPVRGLPYTVNLAQVIPRGATVRVRASAAGVTVTGSGLEVT